MTHSEQLKRAPTVLTCLKTIERASMAETLKQPLAKHYPLMKLGSKTDIAFFADQLAPLAIAHIEANPQIKQWIITAPPHNVIPAAANYICWKIFEQLKQQPALADKLKQIDLKVPKQRMAIKDANDFKTFYEYSNNSIEQRIKERTRLHHGDDDIVIRGDEFKDCGIIVVNDIRVTGTQQEFMQQSFDRVGVADLQWLYIFEVEKQLGLDDPQVEHRINTAKVQTLEEYQAVFTSNDVNYTARCISRLFTHETDQFEHLLRQIDKPRQQQVLDFATREGRYEGEFFAEKFNLLKQIAQSS